MIHKKCATGFYFDSYDLFITLDKKQIEDLYEVYDKGDEFHCVVRFNVLLDLKKFFSHLFEISTLNFSEIMNLTEDYIWDGTTHEVMNQELNIDEEKSEQMMDELYNYVESLYD